MNDYSEKFRFFFLPVLAVTFCFVTGYSFLYWLYYIRLERAYLPTNLTQLLTVIPSSTLVILLFLRRRFNKLPVSDGRNSVKTFSSVFILLLTIVITCLTCKYIKTAKGRVVRVDDLSDIHKHSPSLYYTATNVYADTLNVLVNAGTTFTSKHANLKFLCYAAIPAYSGTYQMAIGTKPVWLAVQCSELHNTGLSEQIQDSLWKIFQARCRYKILNVGRRHFSYLKNLKNTTQYDIFNKGVGSGQANVILEPVYTALDDRADSTALIWAIGLYAALILFALIAAGEITSSSEYKYV
jgi:hypothetical protein